MQWNLEQIRLFVSVAERQSFSAAARELKRVQSAVSNGIALLEADLGVTLFERSAFPVWRCRCPAAARAT